MTANSKMDSGLTYWTLDEVAECLSISRNLSSKLWGFLNDCKNKTPQGGDPSINPDHVETPDGRLDSSNDDKLAHWWKNLSNEEKNEINEAYRKDYGE